MAVKNAMTAEFLHSAYGGESMAHMRYLIWGDMAKKDVCPISRNCLKRYPMLSVCTRPMIFQIDRGPEAATVEQAVRSALGSC